MDELEEKIAREILILNDERQYMKKLSEDVEVGKFGGRVSSSHKKYINNSNRGLVLLQIILKQLKLLH